MSTYQWRGHRLRARPEQTRQPRVIFRPNALAPGHAKGGNLRPLQRCGRNPLKILRILLVRGRIATLNVVKPNLVEPLGNLQLVLQ